MSIKQRLLWFLKYAVICCLLAVIITPLLFVFASTVSGKTLWDWLELLIVPLALVVSAWFLSEVTRRNELAREERRTTFERQIAEDRAQENELQTYLGYISTFLLEHQLGTPNTSNEVKVLARARTLTVLRMLNGERKGLLIRFLYEAGLIQRGTEYIDLQNADLRDVKLRGADLPEISLRGTDLRNADLSIADFHYADFTETHLDGALLDYSDFTGACFENSSVRNLKWNNVKFNGANLSGIWMMNAKPEYVFFDDALLSGAIMSESDLRKCFFRKANLSSVTLTSSNLREVDMTGADLSKSSLAAVNFKDANLTNADLRMSDLSHANLSMANLLHAKIEKEQLNRVASLKKATMPDGSIHN